ncbi:hypothetical protein VTI74DRAFT_5621 [Chaetomium olivicolor]
MSSRESLRWEALFWLLVKAPLAHPDEPASAALEAEWLSAAAEAQEVQQLLSIDCSLAEADSGVQEHMTYSSNFLLQLDRPAVQYRSPRRAATILHLLPRRNSPPISEALDAEGLAACKAADVTVFAAYLGRLTATILLLLQMLRCAQGVKLPAVVCNRNLDEDTVTIEGHQGVAKATRPRMAHSLPLRFYRKGTARASEVIEQVSRSYYGSLISVVVDPFEFPELMNQLGLEANVFPAGAVHQLSENRVYPYPKGKPLTADAIQQWGQDVYQGRIKPWRTPGVTTTSNVFGQKRTATRNVSMANFPGGRIKMAGRDEL